jgi:RNA polymerase sigma factor (sigma-70 family)
MDIPRNNQEFNLFYKENHSRFLAFVRKYYPAMPEIEAEDIYHDAFMVLWRKIQSGETTFTSKLSTYLFAIGKNMVRNFFKTTHETLSDMDTLSDIPYLPEYEFETPIDIQKHELLNRSIKEMGSPCNEVLQAYYWDNYSMREIAEIMGYANEQVAKNRKHKCFEKLKIAVTASFQSADLI